MSLLLYCKIVADRDVNRVNINFSICTYPPAVTFTGCFPACVAFDKDTELCTLIQNAENNVHVRLTLFRLLLRASCNLFFFLYIYNERRTMYGEIEVHVQADAMSET